MPNKPRKPQGFAVLSAERRREIARKGGRAAQAKGRAHQFTSEEAVAAGQKGGRVRWQKRKRQGS
jgi:general stress protein YciG